MKGIKAYRLSTVRAQDDDCDRRKYCKGNQLNSAGQIPVLIVNPMRRKGRGGKKGRKSKRKRSPSLAGWFYKKTPSILFGISGPTPSILSHDLQNELGLQDLFCP